MTTCPDQRRGAFDFTTMEGDCVRVERLPDLNPDAAMVSATDSPPGIADCE
jgi:hypothetical protein